MKPIGNFGITVARLFDKSGKLFGTTMDCPNPVACAMANHPEIAYSVGILGRRDRAYYEDRFWFTKDDAKQYSFFNRL